MKNCIYYFTGTGNSLKVARDISNKIGDCKIIPISNKNLIGKEINYERIGFVFPVYAWGPPKIVSNFLKKIGNISKNTYIFAAVTYRNEAGAVLNYFSKQLRINGLKLNAGFEVCMPGNHIGHYETDSELIIKEKIDKWNIQSKEIISQIQNKLELPLKKVSLFSLLIQTGLLYRIAVNTFSNFDKNFTVSEKCNGCGICKKVCKAENIEIVNGKPSWKGKCEQCLACLHWCSQNSIEIGLKTIGRKRYKNNEVLLKDIIG